MVDEYKHVVGRLLGASIEAFNKMNCAYMTEMYGDIDNDKLTPCPNEKGISRLLT